MGHPIQFLPKIATAPYFQLLNWPQRNCTHLVEQLSWMGLGQLPAYGVGGLWLCSRHLTYLIFTQTQLKLVRLLPVPQSVYNRVTVQLCLIICQSRPLFNLATDNKSQKNANCKSEVEHGFCFCLNLTYHQIKWRDRGKTSIWTNCMSLCHNSARLHNGHQKGGNISSHESFNFRLINSLAGSMLTLSITVPRVIPIPVLLLPEQKIVLWSKEIYFMLHVLWKIAWQDTLPNLSLVLYIILMIYFAFFYYKKVIHSNMIYIFWW